MPRIDHGGDMARRFRDLERRMQLAESALASGDLRATVATLTAQLASTTASLADLAAQVHAATAFPIGVPPVVVPPPPGPLELAAGGVAAATLVAVSTTTLGRVGFVIPAGSHAVSVIGTLTAATHYWNLDTNADAWLEIAGVVASGRVRMTGTPYLSQRTASLRIDTTLGAGQYEAHWVQSLSAGNNIAVLGGEVHIWLNS